MKKMLMIGVMLAALCAFAQELYCVIDLSGGTSATSYPVSYLTDVPSGGWSDTYKTTKLVLRKISAGTFTMGSTTGELGRMEDETQHRVRLTKDYYMGVFPVTQRQWELVMGTRPSYFYKDNCYMMRPVEQVSYNMIRGSSAGAGWPSSSEVDADSFLGVLRAKSGLELDLPTEAQWEYACRAGTTTALNSGRNLTSTSQDSEMDKVGRYYYNGGSSAQQGCDWSAGTAKVGSYAPNAWGLYDTHGNVCEWCLDWADYYSGDETDPKGPASRSSSGLGRVVRGGGWDNQASYCRSALRESTDPNHKVRSEGFRLCCPAAESKPEGGPYTEKVGGIEWTFMVDADMEAVVGTGSIESGTAVPTSTKGAVTIPSELGGRTVIGIANLAFAGCSGMTSVMIPEGITDIGDTAFYNCDGLASVTLPASVVRIGFGVFANCKGLKMIKVAAQSESFAARDGVLFDLDEAELIQCPRGKNGAYAIPSTVTTIRAWAFYKCDNLTSVTIPESVTDIGTSAFAWCKGLTSMTLPFGLTNVGESAFVYCQGLKSVTIPSSVKAIGKDAFLNCDDLKTVYVDEGDERRVKTLMERSGFDTDQVEFRIIGETPTYEVVAGMKVSIDVGFVGYTAKNLPKGLSFNGKTGLVTGTTKVTGTYEATFSKKGEWDETAIFEVRDEEDPEIDCPGLEAGEFTVGVAGESGGIPIGITAESGVKSVSAKNLPAGMKVTQDKLTKEWYITGGPTKAGYYSVTLTVTTAAGNRADQSYVIEVAALPDMAVGAFNGFVTKQDNAERFDPVIGAIQVTATDAGKISAKVTTADKAYSFTAACWDSGKEGRYSVEMSLKTGETLTLELDTGAGWDAHQLTGSFDHRVLSGPFEVSAQRNAFGKTWSFDAEGDATEGWTLTYAENPKTADLTLTLNADGKTTLAGKLGTLKVSASGYSDVSGMKDGAIIADFAPVVTVNKVKTILSIHTNLWFDRSNEHEFIGSAKLMD